MAENDAPKRIWIDPAGRHWFDNNDHTPTAKYKVGYMRADLAAPDVLGIDTNWPLKDVLNTLADAVEHLGRVHDCDCDGWEIPQGIIPIARDYANRVAVQPAASTELCNWCDHPESYLPPTLMEGKWIHIGRDNDGQLCTAPMCVLCSHPWAFSYGEEGSHDNDGHCYFPIGANASGGQRSCYCKCVFPAA